MICNRPKSPGFTLLEILLVILVISIATAAFLPVAMNTVENTRTRAARREIIALNRYARARAILDRKPTAVVYRTEQNKLQLLSLPARKDTEGVTMFGAVAEQDPEAASTEIKVIRSRELPKYVSVTDVKGAEKEEDGYFIIYAENGVTHSHRVTVTAPDGKQSGIHINGLTGEITLED